MKIFVIEGAIGVGKSTILQGLENLGYPVYYEPIDEWKPWLEEFYLNGGSAFAAITLQYKILETIVERTKRIYQANQEVVIMERSLLSGLLVFVAANKELSPDTEWEKVEAEYEKQVQIFEHEDKGLIRIALHCPFDTALTRSRKRGDPDVTGASEYHKHIFNLSEAYEMHCQFKVNTCSCMSRDQSVSEICAIIEKNK